MACRPPSGIAQRVDRDGLNATSEAPASAIQQCPPAALTARGRTCYLLGGAFVLPPPEG